MKRFFYLIFLLVAPALGWAQAKFIYSGKIEFERKINVQRQSDADWIKDMITQLPPFHTSTFALDFDSTSTHYQLSSELPVFNATWLLGPSKENVVDNDLVKGTSHSSKGVFEATYIINDSLNNMHWRMTGETRTIAGFECRKAVGIICDSVYVVAFYTEEIPVSSGPESFNGLPGMILGVVIPRLYTTWFATKLVLGQPRQKAVAVSRRARTIDKNKLQTELLSSFQNWGEEKQRNIWWVML